MFLATSIKGLMPQLYHEHSIRSFALLPGLAYHSVAINVEWEGKIEPK